eukprot:TRINITY_DN51708_c0_g1_i1.p1 TRINITY_DN51708_c0_g1~~TRINITY_DN51708_c0_g1_i1.p1  ORF type:complete len:259 (-),score=28.38 TRINITY_DN51708_c0_g1_i1:319-1095(-)
MSDEEGEWSRRYESAHQLLVSQINHLSTTPSIQIEREAAEFHRKLARAETETKWLHENCHFFPSNLTESGLAERRQLLAKLDNEKIHFSQALNQHNTSTTITPNSSHLSPIITLPGGGHSTAGHAQQQQQRQPPTLQPPHHHTTLSNTSFGQQHQMQYPAETMGDADAIEEAFTARQPRHFIGMLGNELNEHQRLLSTLDEEVSEVTAGISREKTRMARLLHKNTTRSFYCIVCAIAFTFITILLLALLGFMRNGRED